MQRYSIELDQGRLDAGWGRHAWLMDAGRRIRLLPANEARDERDRLNVGIVQAQEFGLLGRVTNKLISLIEKGRRILR